MLIKLTGIFDVGNLDIDIIYKDGNGKGARSIVNLKRRFRITVLNEENVFVRQSKPEVSGKDSQSPVSCLLPGESVDVIMDDYFDCYCDNYFNVRRRTSIKRSGKGFSKKLCVSD